MRRLSFLILAVAAALSSTACAIPHDPKFTLESGGHSRNFYVHLPKYYSTSNRWPLVFVIHGRTGTGPGMERIAYFDSFADRNGIIAIYPNGVSRSWADGRGDSPAERDGVDDIAFFSAMLDKLESTYSVDTSRVYASGLSNGGFMSYRLACELSARIAAVAPVGATFSATLSENCHPSRPVSVLEINGTEDPLVPYDGGQVRHGSSGRILSARDSVAYWARIDGCPATPVRDSFHGESSGGFETRHEIYSGCRDNVEVALYSVVGGGHTWPGGRQYLPALIIGKTSRDFDANDIIWKFFQAHPLH
ncbi:MAG TPA: PHB depolymerase family esterase [Candidatus Cybelea sp.]|nr:PHB depolymerase family esterase [Candidatus Cybelea sp.]